MLLRGVLTYVSDGQLESSLSQIPPPVILDHSSYKGSASSKVWQCYPLTTVTDVRAWQAHTSNSELSRPRRYHSSDSDSPIDGREELPESYANLEGPVAVAVDGGTSTPSRVGYPTGSEALETDTASSPSFSHYPPITSPSILPTRISHVGGSQAPEGEMGLVRDRTGGQSVPTTSLLTADFQDEFLW